MQGAVILVDRRNGRLAMCAAGPYLRAVWSVEVLIMELRSAALAALLVTGTAHAQGELDIMVLANELGMVIASDQHCGLTFDQAAIQRFIDDNVPPEALGFASNLQTMVQGNSFMLQGQSESARTAHCRAVENTARHYGFVE